ncbi:MAG: radical SAM protein [Elusimicrobia bacterium]|nr:radical SAM protein [Elusimicrobiota bacterium]
MKNRALDKGLAFGADPLKIMRIWPGSRLEKYALLARYYGIFSKSARRRKKMMEKESVKVPHSIILSTTMKCNLACSGCYSRGYGTDNELGAEEIDSLLDQAEDIGVSVIVVTGGEPLMKRGMLKTLLAHRRLIFFLYTNGLFIDEDFATAVKKNRNIIPLVSLEGDKIHTDSRRDSGVYDKVASAMKLLDEKGAAFGFSCMVTQENYRYLSGEEFVNSMIGRGCRIGFYVDYVPSGADSAGTVICGRDKDIFRQNISGHRAGKNIVIIHMPDDEYGLMGRCMAAAEGFVHINAKGDLEPCPFFHYSADNIRKKTLLEALRSQFLADVRDYPGLTGKPGRGCVLYENTRDLMPVIEKNGAVRTD